jgi:sterol desaturase/sphingolipid hydroxylase (fatty acid hydroxylase superfamily)
MQNGNSHRRPLKMLGWFHDLYADFFGSDVLVAPEYLLLSLPIAWIIYRIQRRSGRAEGGFWRWVAPREIWLHRSHRLDLVLFIIGRLMGTLGLMGRVTLATGIAAWVAGLIAPAPKAANTVSPWFLAALIWLAYDFTAYWVHRAYHRIRMIWPLHAVHHSAEVMTPFTYYRQHPGAVLLTALLQSLIAGTLQGLIVGLLNPATLAASIAGINAVAVLANLLMANFHHSHIWVSFGPVVEHVLISPAQHQVHHSTNPAHFNRNFGQTLALWDWLFGTLYLTRAHEDIRLGLDAEVDAPLRTHRLSQVLLDPLRRMLPGR